MKCKHGLACGRVQPVARTVRVQGPDSWQSDLSGSHHTLVSTWYAVAVRWIPFAHVRVSHYTTNSYTRSNPVGFQCASCGCCHASSTTRIVACAVSRCGDVHPPNSEMRSVYYIPACTAMHCIVPRTTNEATTTTLPGSLVRYTVDALQHFQWDSAPWATAPTSRERRCSRSSVRHDLFNGHAWSRTCRSRLTTS